MNADIMKDIALLTTIPKYSLDKLSDIESRVIAHNISEEYDNQDKVITLNIGIGCLYLDIDGDTITYKFNPSNKLNRYIREAILQDVNPLESILEESLNTKLLQAYKDLF